MRLFWGCYRKNGVVRAADQEYHFTIGFFGANGISRHHGCSTPDDSEALVKKAVCKQCRRVYILADSTKFDEVSSVSSAEFQNVQIIAERIPEGYEKFENILPA